MKIFHDIIEVTNFQVCSEIESLSPKNIELMLHRYGLRHDSKDLQDYVLAKNIVFSRLLINPYVYEEHIKSIEQYLGI